MSPHANASGAYVQWNVKLRLMFDLYGSDCTSLAFNKRESAH